MITLFHKKFKKLSILLLLGLIWGSGYVIAKFAIENGVPPLGYSFWQSIGPALILFIIARIKQEIHFSWKYTQYYLVCGILGIAIPNSVMYFSATHLPAGLLSVIVNTVPIFTYPLALLAQQEEFQWKRLLALFIGIGGILLLILPKASLPTTEMIPWASFTLITPLCFALCAIYINRKQPKDSSPLSLSAGMLLSAGIVLTPFIYIIDSFYPLWFPLKPADWAIILEIILSSLGYVLFFKLLKLAGPVYYSLVGGVVCLTGLFWGHILYNETLNSINFLAICAILIAIVTITSTSAKKGEL